MFREILLAAAGVLFFAGGVIGNGSGAAEATAAIVEGIAPYQVFPRKGGRGDIPFTVLQPGALSVEVVRDPDGLVVARQDWMVRSRNEKLALEQVPVGGEYTLRFRQGESEQSIGHVLVGEIWVVGGQSNAYGAEGVASPSIPEVHIFRNGWQEGRDPLFGTFLMGNLAEGKTLVTPWIDAAQDYYYRTGIPVGLMGYCAPAKEIDFFMDGTHRESPPFQSLVESHGRGASVFLWYQGESDSEGDRHLVYKDRLHALAAALRRYADNPEMRMVIIQLSWVFRMDTPKPEFGRIREIQRQFCVEDPHGLLIPALPYEHRDPIHLSEEGNRRLARRISQGLAEAENAGTIVWQGPRVARLRFTDPSRRRVEVYFDSARRLILTSDDSGRDPMELWKEQWFVTDSAHQGAIEPGKPRVRSGRVEIPLVGGAWGRASATEDGNLLQVEIENTGYITPMRVRVDGLRLTLELTAAAQPGAKLSYAIMNGSQGFLEDEQGRPAAAFMDVEISEP